MLSDIEIGCFVSLFNRGGYVLNFSTADFDAFTYQYVGVPLCEKYGLSKGKSLLAYTREASKEEIANLLFALLEHYEIYYQSEFDASAEDNSYFSHYDAEKARLYAKCREIRDRETNVSPGIEKQVEYIKSKFTSTYMHEQIGLLMEMRTRNPTEAIGKSKELIESCCKTILNEYGVAIDPNWSVARLSKETARCLKVDAESADSEDRIVQQILGSLQGIASGLAEFRNAYGSGHGKGDGFVPLPVRHAKLAVGSAVTLVEYFWETFEWRNGSDC